MTSSIHCHPERSGSRLLRAAQSKDLHLDFIACAILLATAASAQAQTVTLPIPELHTTATLTFEPDNEHKETYRAVTVDCNGHRERFLRKPGNTIFRIPPPGAEFSDTGVPSSVRGLTVAPSRLFLTSPAPRTLIFFISQAGASDADALYVLGFHPDGTPYRVLVKDHLDPFKVEVGPGTDVRIYGAPALSEVVAGEGGNGSRKPYATSYDPREVYVVHEDAAAVLSPALTAEWNRRNDVWALGKNQDNYTAVYNLPGHKSPVGATQQQADELIDAANKAGQKHP